MQNIDKILDELGLSPAEKAVYLSLLQGAKSVKEIMQISLEKRPTVYYSLNNLENLGLVSKTGKDYGNKFQLEPIDKLVNIAEKNLKKSKDLLKTIELFSKNYKNAKENNNTITVSYFDNIQTIKSSILYTLYSKNKEIKSIVPEKNFFTDMGIEFISNYVENKQYKNIKTKAIWENIPDKNTLQKYYKSSQIKQLPENMHNSFQMTVFIYDDKTLYVAPKKELYAVLIQSKEHSNFMNSIFNNLWDTSCEINF